MKNMTDMRKSQQTRRCDGIGEQTEQNKATKPWVNVLLLTWELPNIAGCCDSWQANQERLINKNKEEPHEKEHEQRASD